MSTGLREIRQVFINKMLELNNITYPYKLKYTTKDKYNISKNEYEDTLLNTIFALCPEGANPATWRFHEALLNGAIPIINITTLHNYYQYFIPCNITTLLIASTDPIKVIKRLMSRKHILESRRKRLITLYELWLEDGKQLLADRRH